MSKHTVLIADDDNSIRVVLSQALAREGFQVRVTSNASTLWKWVKEGEGDLVLTDVNMPDGSVFDFLPRMRMDRPELPIIVMSAQNTVLTAISAAEQGAYEYLPKPFDLDVMTALVRRALEGRVDYSAAARQKKAEKDEKLPLIGRSAPMQDVYRVLSRVAGSDLAVLVQGESGVGKRLVARSLHDFSRRRNGPFVVVSLAAVGQEALNLALFGRGDEKGAIAKAQGGTILLDGLADAPAPTQAFLGRMLSDPEGMGDVRIIASSDRDLKLLVSQGLFREDLYYRLNVVSISVPNLRDRKDDIADLARAFLARAAARGLPEKALDKGAAEALGEWPWPGNVRELENLITRLAALHPDVLITEDAVRAELARETLVSQYVPESDGDEDAAALARRAIGLLYQDMKSGGGLAGQFYDSAIALFEQPLFALALAETRGNQIKAADLLGLNRNTLRKRLQTLGIDPNQLKP